MQTLIIDGSNLLFRAYWIAESRPKFLNSQGEWTGPLFLFLKSLKSLQDKFSPSETYVCWDKKLKYPSTNFRKQLAPETYKQNRDSELASKVHEQHDLIENWLKDLGVKQMYPGCLEADDVISWLCQEKCTSSTIVTVDQDLLQLVNSNTHFYNPHKKKLVTLENFEEEIGVTVNHLVYYKALLGDKSDNIDGIEGYGTVKSKRLVLEGYEGIKKVLDEDQQRKFDKNVFMIDLLGSYNKEEGETDCYQKQYEELKTLKTNIKEFERKCYEAEFYSIIKSIDSWKESFGRSQTLIDLISQLQ
jgi:DNA polymerase I